MAEPKASDYISLVKEKMLSGEDKPLTIKTKTEDILFKGFNGIISDLMTLTSNNAPQKLLTRDILNTLTGFMDIGSSRVYTPYVERISYPEFKISIYYPLQFQALRALEGINHNDFIYSIGCSSTWADNSGGKTRASFVKSYDNLYVFKTLKKFEFNMLVEICDQYFNYMWKCAQSNQETPTRLAKIIGMYEVTSKAGGVKYYIAMQNVFFGIKPTRIYDLKGSDFNRYIPNPKPGQVLLDTNFKLDQNGEPIGIEEKKLKEILQGLRNDAQFLSNMARVDYSLLLALDDEKMVCKVGIIDYLREYTLDKQIEHIGKVVMNRTTPTIVKPVDYSRRFLETMERYFMMVTFEETASDTFEEEKEQEIKQIRLDVNRDEQ